MQNQALRITLNDSEIATLRKFARETSGRESERAHFVLLSHSGFSADAIGKLMYAAENTVKEWLRRYRAEGVSGLADKPKGGRPVKDVHLTDIVEAQISQPPSISGYAQNVWTLLLLVMHLRERFKLVVSVSTVRRGLRKIRYSWHRPKLSPAHKPDPLADERRAGLMAVLAVKSAILLAVDECDICLLAILRSMWQRIGEQLRLPTPGQNAKIGIFGAVNLRTGALTTLCAARKRSADFICFLEHVMAVYAVGTIYIILDNASIHHSAQTKKWLVLHPRIQLVCLPTYSGHQLNPIEKVWWLLKQHVAANRNFKCLDDLSVAVQHWLAAAEPERILDLINCQVTRAAALAPLGAQGSTSFE